MGHYFSEMCCQKCGKIPCKCKRKAVRKKKEKKIKLKNGLVLTPCKGGKK
jgi:hypothetical protein